MKNIPKFLKNYHIFLQSFNMLVFRDSFSAWNQQFYSKNTTRIYHSFLLFEMLSMSTLMLVEKQR